MSAAADLDWPLALADGHILSDVDCDILLDYDVINSSEDDILTAFPTASASLKNLTLPETLSFYPTPASELKASQITEEDYDNQLKKENFSGWLEEKVDLPVYDAIPNVPALAQYPLATHHAQTVSPNYDNYYQQPHQQQQTITPEDTRELLREFENVYVNVELTHLTPPQSPPGPATQLLLNYAQQAQNVSPHMSPDELAVVEEIMRHGVAQMSPTASLDTSPLSSQMNSPSSQMDSPQSSPHSQSSSDDEWQYSSSSSRPKPYARPTEDRRRRKKEQNKNAATRYRQKKKAEIEVLLQEESSLRQRHGELRTKCSDVQREIRYLKGLMRDLFKAKGLIK